MKTFDIKQCADFLKINTCTAMKMAAAGKIPGAKIGRAWVFLEDDLVAYLHEQVRKQTNQRESRSGNQAGARELLHLPGIPPIRRKKQVTLPPLPKHLTSADR